MPELKAKLVIYTGSMYASKTSALLAQGERHSLAGHKVVYVKPAIDNRYSEEEIATHSGLRAEAISVSTTESICTKEVEEAEVVLVDEAQFLSHMLIWDVQVLLDLGKVVYVSGLDMDYRGVVFGNTTALMGIADEVYKLKAVCNGCGDDAYASYKLAGSKEVRVEVGSADMYIPLCRGCYKEHRRQEHES